MDCSGLLGRTPLRRVAATDATRYYDTLFRSSRPDSIETPGRRGRYRWTPGLFRSSRPDSIETVMQS